MASFDILYIRPAGSGWGPVHELVQLTGRLFDARLIEVDDTGDVNRFQRAAALLPRGPRVRDRHLLVVGPQPAAIAHIALPRLWLPGYRSVAVWIIDSFWTDRTPRLLRDRPHVDRLFITDPQLVSEWSGQTGLPVGVLPWGSDTTRFTSVQEGTDRPVDVLRVGRQPSAWSDDERTSRDATAHGLHFAGRPPFSDDPARNQMLVREAMERARVVLAFSNLVSPAPYTHPTRDYLTGRWTDALAAGCLVAGTAPASAASLLWPGATVELSPTSRHDAWPVLAQLASEWTPQAAADRQAEARRRLDWRYRLRDLCIAMDWAVPDRLTAELATL